MRDGPKNRVGGVAAHAELIEVGLADDDGASGAELRDDGGFDGAVVV